MKSLLSSLIACCAFATGVAHAQLSDAGNGLINHPAANMTWEADGGLFRTMAAANPNLANEIVAAWGNMPLPFGHVLRAEPFNSEPQDFYPVEGQMTYWGAIAWIHYLNVTHHKGYSDWRLPDIGPIRSPGSCGGACYPGDINSSEWWRLFGQELGGVFGTSITTIHNANYDLFTQIGSGWSDNIGGDLVNQFGGDGGQGRNGIQTTAWAWPVRTGVSILNPPPMGYPVLPVIEVTFPDTITFQRGAPQTFTLTNRGDGPLTISALTTTSPIQDDEFVATHNCPTPIAAGASCTVSITFRPVDYFITRGTLTITSDGKPRTIALSGNGILGVDLTPSATTVTVGQSVTLDWAASSPDIHGCTTTGGSAGDGWAGTGGQFGSRNVTATTAGQVTYTVTCSKGSVATDSVVITYTVPTATISATSTNIVRGQANSLTWTSANADACTASSNGSGGWTGARATNGSASVTEQTLGMITYTITCTSASQSGQASVNVFVNAPPAPPAPPSSGGGGGSFELLTLFGLLSALGLQRRKVHSAVR
jgi:hypothetical protein